ncbi:MAG: hypothetical protein R6V25_02775 [Desulfatiglandales bacterium]
MVLELDKKSSFLNWKLASAQKAFLDGHYHYNFHRTTYITNPGSGPTTPP